MYSLGLSVTFFRLVSLLIGERAGVIGGKGGGRGRREGSRDRKERERTA